ncbi:MAG: hypothetical protein WCG05_02750 [Alphaproteobacteria bacterium]
MKNNLKNSTNKSPLFWLFLALIFGIPFLGQGALEDEAIAKSPAKEVSLDVDALSTLLASQSINKVMKFSSYKSEPMILPEINPRTCKKIPVFKENNDVVFIVTPFTLSLQSTTKQITISMDSKKVIDRVEVAGVLKNPILKSADQIILGFFDIPKKNQIGEKFYLESYLGGIAQESSEFFWKSPRSLIPEDQVFFNSYGDKIFFYDFKENSIKVMDYNAMPTKIFNAYRLPKETNPDKVLADVLPLVSKILFRETTEQLLFIVRQPSKKSGYFMALNVNSLQCTCIHEKNFYRYSPVVLSDDYEKIVLMSPLEKRLIIMDLTQKKFLQKIELGKTPSLALFSHDGQHLFVSTPNTVEVINIKTGENDSIVTDCLLNYMTLSKDDHYLLVILKTLNYPIYKITLNWD